MEITEKIILRNQIDHKFRTITHGFNYLKPLTSHYVRINKDFIKIFIEPGENNHDSYSALLKYM
jgi:hypothetical protein